MGTDLHRMENNAPLLGQGAATGRVGQNDARGGLVKKAITPDSEWQRIWFSARHRQWTSLALVPSDASVDVDWMAEMLATTGRMRGERPVSVVKATNVQLEGLQ